MLRSVALVRTDVSDELSASLIRVTRIGELGTTLAVSSNRRTLRRNSHLRENLKSYIECYRCVICLTIQNLWLYSVGWDDEWGVMKWQDPNRLWGSNRHISDGQHKPFQKPIPWPLVRERTTPTERPPLVSEIFLLLKCQITIYLTV
jgi:hypothetical protein